MALSPFLGGQKTCAAICQTLGHLFVKEDFSNGSEGTPGRFCLLSGYSGRAWDRALSRVKPHGDKFLFNRQRRACQDVQQSCNGPFDEVILAN